MERGKLGPSDGTPTTLQTGLQFPTKGPEILDGRHPLGGLRLNTGRTHPTGARKLRLGARRGERARHAPGGLSTSGGEGTKRRLSESVLLWRTRKLEPHATQGPLHVKQPGA